MRIIFVCTGNTCRSSMAEALAKRWLAVNARHRPDIIVASAGLAACPGSPASLQAVEVMGRRGIDLTSHCSRQFTRETVGQGDIILTMTEHHKQSVLSQDPDQVWQVFTLAEFAGWGPGMNIPDPYGLPVSVYENCAAHLEELVDKALHNILEQTYGAGSR